MADKKIQIEVLDFDTDNGVIGTLDVTDSQDFPLSLNITVSDGKNLESRFGDFSKSFDIPATKNNNRIFKHIYNSQVVNESNIYAKKECRILVDSLEFFKGQIQIQGSMQDKNPKSYSCTIYGGNFTWVNDIKEKRLCDLEFSSVGTKTFDFTEIQNSWSKTQANSEVIYPLVSYGDFFPTSTDGGVNAIDDTDVSVDWRGWFWVYNLLKEIFKNIGYKIDSTFIETANFKKLITHFGWGREKTAAENLNNVYLLNTERQGSTPSTIQFIGCVDVANLGTTGTLVGDDSLNNPIIYPNEISDSSGSHNASTGVWTCQQTGMYRLNALANYALVLSKAPNIGQTMKITWKFVHKNSSGTVLNTFKNVILNETNVFGNIAYSFEGNLINSDNSNANGYFQVTATDTIQSFLDIESTNHGPPPSSPSYDPFWRYGILFYDYKNLVVAGATVYSTPFFKLELDTSNIGVGQTFTMQDALPCDVKQIDFVKSIAHMFNLQFYTDVQSKKVYIEPYNDFYADVDTAYNWSNKIDYAQGMTDTYDLGLKQEMVFKYKEDSNDKYLEYLNRDDNDNQLQNPLFSQEISLSDNFPKGKKEIENPLFAPTFQTWDNDTVRNPFTNGVLIPVMWKEVVPEATVGFDSGSSYIVERPDKGYNYEPRILYYQGQIVTPNSTNHLTLWSVNYSLAAPYVLDISNYPRATFVDYEDASFPSLSFRDENITPPNSGTTTTVKGLYNTYYKKMVTQMTKSPRIRSVYVNLKIKDVLNIDLRRLVFFDGSMWRINKIVDFSPAKNIPTKVEFIQWFEV